MDERVRILDLIESGQIDVEEGVRRLEELNRAETGPAPEAEGRAAPAAPADVAASQSASQAEPAAASVHLPWVRIVWQIVFGVGVTVMAGGGLLLARAQARSPGREGMPGLTWGWVLFILGLLVLVLGWWLQRARWFYLRVREHDGAAFTIALPLPLGLVLWLLRVARPFVPQLQEMGDVDQLILAMRDELRDGRSFVIDVDEGEGGDQVEIYFC